MKVPDLNFCCVYIATFKRSWSSKNYTYLLYSAKFWQGKLW